MKRRRLIVATALVTLLAAVAFAVQSHRANAAETTALVRAAQATAPGHVLELEQVVGGLWDRAMIAGPYQTQEAIRKTLGGRLPPELDAIDIASRDDIDVLIFVNPDGTSKALALDRGVADFGEPETMRLMQRPKARLVRAASGVNFAWQAR